MTITVLISFNEHNNTMMTTIVPDRRTLNILDVLNRATILVTNSVSELTTKDQNVKKARDR